MSALGDTGALGITPRRVMRAEWIKLRTLRSVPAAFAVALALMAGLGILSALLTVNDWATMTPADRADLSVTGRLLAGRLFTQLAIGVVAALAITSEYASGTIRVTLAAVPRRLPVLWSKLALYGAITWVLMTAGAFVAFFAGNAILARHWQFSISDPGVLRVVLMTGVTLTALSLIATALGFVLRGTAATISAVVTLVLVLPILGDLAPGAAQYLPHGAMGALVTIEPTEHVLSPAAGAVLLAVYVAAAIAAAAVALRRRDA